VIFNEDDENTWLGDISGAWLPCDPPEDMFETKEDLWQAYLTSQRDEGSKFSLKRQTFLTDIQHELNTRGLKSVWWQDKKKRVKENQFSVSSTLTPVCQGVRLKSFNTANEFEDLLDQVDSKK